MNHDLDDDEWNRVGVDLLFYDPELRAELLDLAKRVVAARRSPWTLAPGGLTPPKRGVA